jgi:hypothetical protein
MSILAKERGPKNWGRTGIDRKVNGLVSMPEYDNSPPLPNGYQPLLHGNTQYAMAA